MSFDFVETPLQDVLGFLSSLSNVTIVLDTEAIKGQAPQITLRVHEMPLASALNWVCKLAGLSYTLRDQAVFVSSARRIHDKTVVRIFDVSDLTMEIKNFKGRATALATDAGQGGEFDASKDFFPAGDEEEEQKGFSGEALIQFIRQVIAPSGWNPEDALGEPVGRWETPADRGRELADVVRIVVGGRTYVVTKTRE